jgi:SAM-dependent methyltransferase
VVNVEQAAAWDGHEGDVWTEHADRYDRAAARVVDRFFDGGHVRRDDRVLDVGCGTGAPTRRAARIADRGHVVGIDLSSRMLERARAKSADEGIDNVTFVRGDAQVHPFEIATYDLVMSSFGAMFFDDPVAAFSNLHGSLRPEGRVALLAWRTLPENEWLVVLREALAVGRELSLPPPDAPTPFALADPDRVRRVLGRSGFDEIELEPIDEVMTIGSDVADALAFTKTMGIYEGLTADLDADGRARAITSLEARFAEYETIDGVAISSAAWLIAACRR